MKMSDSFFSKANEKFIKVLLSLRLKYNLLFFFETQPSCFLVSYLITPVLASLQSPGTSGSLFLKNKPGDRGVIVPPSVHGVSR